MGLADTEAGIPTAEVVVSPLARKPRRIERAAELLLRVVALTSIASVILILAFVAREAIPILTNELVRREVTPAGMITPNILADGTEQYTWQPVSEIPKYNLVPLVVGSLKVTILALLIAAPLSIAAAVYVSEFAKRRAREIVKPVIELLAGIPSVVIGFFALIVLASWVQKTFGTEHRLNSLVAGIGLALAVSPLIFTVSEDALRAVPTSYRTAALALGSDRFQMITRVVLPAAMPGILASLVLGFGRAIGETMIVVLASGNAALVSGAIGVSARTITATIAQELGEVVVGSAHYHVLFALGALLFVTTFVLNFLGERVIHGLRRKLGMA
ncbi:MAG TPA: phosphate ABC transporter permease subunit PstC [Polyangiaceae bacterium]|nr:phosphate ABC transporter permease subunit PstC [Polyangiaceae bacterium]